MAQEKKFIDPKKFSSDEYINNIDRKDNLITLIGYVKSFRMSQPTDKKQKFELVISNGESKEVQGVAWDSKPIQLACETVTETLMVVQIAMASAHYVPFDKRRFNKGNVDFELLITNNTRIKKSGYFKCEKKNPDIKTVEISNLIKGPSTIYVQGYLKTCLDEVITKKGKHIIGCITNGIYKIELRVYCYSDSNCLSALPIGTFLQVKGQISKGYNCPDYLYVQGPKDIEVIPNQPAKTLIEIYEGWRYPPKLDKTDA